MSTGLDCDTVILGAGPAGIGAAIGLGSRAMVLERAPEVAGLSRTIVLDGAVFDLGGHSFHTPHEKIRKLVFGAVPMEEQRRDAWCLVAGSWIRYPFQQHFGDLPDPALRNSCARDLAAATAGDWRQAEDFDRYLELSFGRTIADAFLRPYNVKLWGGNLARMSARWTEERVAPPAGTRQRSDDNGGVRLPLLADTKVAYPERGGFGEIFRSLARQIPHLRLGEECQRIDLARRTLQTSRGDTLKWRRIVSTLPLPELIAMMPHAPAEIVERVNLLEALPVYLVMVVLEGRGQVDRQRVYSAGDELTGHKIVFNNTSSIWLREQPRHGILVEVAGAKEHDTAVLARDTVAGLVRTGLIDRSSEVRRVEVTRLALGYPVPTHACAPAVHGVRSWLEEQGVAIAGRFAEWAYINADEALARGMTVGEALVDGD